MNAQLQIILHATAIALNNERRFVYPPVGDTIGFLEEPVFNNFELIGQFKNDWTIGFDKDRGQYVVEIIASRRGELPAEFGQNSYFVIGGIIFQVIEPFALQSHTDTQEPFVNSSLRPTVKIYCSITKRTFAG